MAFASGLHRAKMYGIVAFVMSSILAFYTVDNETWLAGSKLRKTKCLVSCRETFMFRNERLEQEPWVDERTLDRKYILTRAVQEEH